MTSLESNVLWRHLSPVDSIVIERYVKNQKDYKIWILQKNALS